MLLVLSVLAVFEGHKTFAGNNPGSGLLSVEEAVLLKKQDHRAIYIDVRCQEKFTQAHIPTAINIPLHFIRTKPYLKNMTVIIVDEGYRLDPLIKEQRRLNETGFTVKVLAGGIAAWNQQRKKLIGDSLPGLTLNIIPADSLLPTVRSSHFKLLVDASSPTSRDPIIPEAILMPIADKRAVESLNSFIKEQKLSTKTAVLVFNQNGDYGLFQKAIEDFTPTMFFLRNGSESYREAVSSSMAMLAPVKDRRKTVGRCETCPPVTDIEKVNE